MRNRKTIDDSFFNHDSIAVAGVSTVYNAGKAYIELLLASGFKGKIYPLNPKAAEISGLKAYPGIGEVPGPVDYVVSCLPKEMALQLISDCAAKGVKALSFFTAGFSELGREEGRELQAKMRQAAETNGLRVLGPNCMGLYVPRLGMSFASDLPRETGRMALIGQSGGNVMHLIRFAAQRGVRFSKVVSYGNAADVDESDLLEYFKNDKETDAIAAYIEGLRDGGRFRRLLEDVSALKPVAILKAGKTREGALAVSSHTGSLAGSSQVWDGLLDGVGAARAHDLDELVDMMVTFSFMAPPPGRRVCLAGASGGFSVLSADEFIDAGFSLPQLPREGQERMERLMKDLTGTDAGVMLRNPYDIGGFGLGDGVYRSLRDLAGSGAFDFMVGHVSINNSGWPGPASPVSAWPDLFVDALARVRAETGIPMAVALYGVLMPRDLERLLNLQRRCSQAGLPVYHSTADAARALNRFMSMRQAGKGILG
ncbi:MAG: CoA-binding protein [Chloroflexi bacterium]|nr:CoA-binding protein [Chloroflexota bacterium]